MHNYIYTYTILYYFRTTGVPYAPGQSIAGRYVSDSDPLEGPARGRELVQVRQEVDRATQTARVFWRNAVFGWARKGRCDQYSNLLEECLTGWWFGT